MKQRTTLFAILMMALAFPQTARAYDFWEISSTGDTLYYRIQEESTTPGNEYTYLAVTYPGTYEYSEELEAFDGWGGHVRPSGNVVIPNAI